MMTETHLPFTYPDRPQRVYWETTRACDLACRHCRAEAAPDADPDELSTAEGRQLLQQIAAFGDPLPHVVLTGGDPLKRRDLFEMIRYARELGLGVSVAPSATPLLTDESLRQLRQAGVEAMSLSLDGATARRHDAIRGVTGTLARTLAAAKVAREIGLPFQVNTLVCGETLDDLPMIFQQVQEMGAARWSLFFLVTVGRGQVLEPISAVEAEDILLWLADVGADAARRGLIITTTEAPQFRRVAMQRNIVREGLRLGPASQASEHGARHGHSHQQGARSPHRAAGIRDGNGILFISHTGEICPSGFLDVTAGNVRRDDLVEVYRTSSMFEALRDAGSFGGRCGHCEFRWICGGSRARAYAASGDLLAEDPLCVHQPA